MFTNIAGQLKSKYWLKYNIQRTKVIKFYLNTAIIVFFNLSTLKPYVLTLKWEDLSAKRATLI